MGPGGGSALAPNADPVRKWLKAGGHLLAIGLDQQEANVVLPHAIATKKAEHICTVFGPPGRTSLLAGVGPADVHNRDPRDVDLVVDGAMVLGNGVLAVAANENVVFCQLSPWHFDYTERYNLKRTFRRASYVVTRVLGNMGCGGDTPLLERFSDPVDPEAERGRWLDGFYLDEPQEFDDPYRSFGW